VSKSSQNAINIINIITFVVIVVGAASLFIVLSGFAGLKTFSLSFSNKFDPDLKATATQGKFFSFTPETENQLLNVDGLAFYAPEIEERILLAYKEKNQPAYVKGILPNYTAVTQADSILYYGKWLGYNANEVVAGLGIANSLGLGVNDFMNPLQVLAPKPGKGSLSGTSKPYNQFPTSVSGVYSLNEEIDKKYVFAPLPLVQVLLEKDSTQITGLNFKLLPEADEAQVKTALQAILGNSSVIKTRAELNDSLYKMLNTENLATYLIFTLVLIIALFNVIGAIIMMILDKKENLKTLFSLGTSVKELKRIFFIQGLLVSVFGGIIGLVIALLLVWTQIQFGWLKITPSLPYPVEIKLINVFIVLATITVLGYFAAKIASSRISKKLIA
jgi:lipoprotein-releasing system permease protein